MALLFRSITNAGQPARSKTNGDQPMARSQSAGTDSSVAEHNASSDEENDFSDMLDLDTAMAMAASNHT